MGAMGIDHVLAAQAKRDGGERRGDWGCDSVVDGMLSERAGASMREADGRWSPEEWSAVGSREGPYCEAECRRRAPARCRFGAISMGSLTK